MSGIVLFNDTGKHPHLGCRAVSDAHRRMLERGGIGSPTVVPSSALTDVLAPCGRNARLPQTLADVFGGARTVVVNGEGTLHHGAGMHLIHILAWALHIGLKAGLVNAVVQSCDDALPVLRRLTDVVVRDLCSSAYLTAAGVRHRVLPDSILEAGFSSSSASSFAGRVVVTDSHWSRAETVGRALRGLVQRLGRNGSFFPLRHPDRISDWREAVAKLRSADLLVTGRHHGIYLALMAGIPFVALDSNSWKMRGLLDMLNPRLEVHRSDTDLMRACALATADWRQFRAYSARFLEARPLSTFECLL